VLYSSNVLLTFIPILPQSVSTLPLPPTHSPPADHLLPHHLLTTCYLTTCWPVYCTNCTQLSSMQSLTQTPSSTTEINSNPRSSHKTQHPPYLFTDPPTPVPNPIFLVPTLPIPQNL
jgi:hypothetical protein